MEPRNKVTSDLGVRLLVGLLAPFANPQLQHDIAAATGRQPDDLFADAERVLAQFDHRPDSLIRAGFFATLLEQVSLEAKARLGRLLRRLATGESGQQALHLWTNTATRGLIKKPPVDAPEVAGPMVAMTVVAADDEWVHPGADAALYIEGSRWIGGFRQQLPVAALTQVGDALVVTNPLKGGLQVRIAVHHAGVGPAVDALNRLGAAETPVTHHPLLRHETVEGPAPLVPFIDVTLPNMTVSTEWQVAEDADRWGIRRLLTDPDAVPGLGEGLFSTALAQVACAEMSRRGFRAAAVTAAALAAGLPPLSTETHEQVYLRVDRPFAFAVDDTDTGLRLFEGQIEDLAAAAPHRKDPYA